jgi:hypothetical protein
MTSVVIGVLPHLYRNVILCGYYPNLNSAYTAVSNDTFWPCAGDLSFKVLFMFSVCNIN